MGLLNAMFIIVAIGTMAAWWVTLRKFYPLYKAGHYTSGYNWLLAVLVALLLWESLMLIALPGFRSTWLATMLTVLWAIGVMAWLTLSTVTRTRQQVRSETAQAGPQPQPVPPAPDVSRYKVRAAPQTPTGSAPRSSRVRRIQSMEA